LRGKQNSAHDFHAAVQIHNAGQDREGWLAAACFGGEGAEGFGMGRRFRLPGCYRGIAKGKLGRRRNRDA